MRVGPASKQRDRRIRRSQSHTTSLRAWITSDDQFDPKTVNPALQHLTRDNGTSNSFTIYCKSSRERDNRIYSTAYHLGAYFGVIGAL